MIPFSKVKDKGDERLCNRESVHSKYFTNVEDLGSIVVVLILISIVSVWE